jgi:hypothetical protein
MFPEVEALIADFQSDPAYQRAFKKTPDLGQEYFANLRDFFAQLYEDGADDPDVIELLDGMRRVLRQKNRTAEERADAMPRWLNIWMKRQERRQ